MKKIKVCHVVSGLKSGGVESMIYNYCSLLDLNEYEMHILYQHEAMEKNLNEFIDMGFKLKRIPSKVKHPIKNFFESYKYLKKNEINVVHCHMTIMNFIPLLAAKILKIPIRICHSHNSDVREKNKMLLLVEKVLKFICIKNATHLIACGNDAGRYMYNDKEFLIINNALDLEKFKYNELLRKKIRKKYNIKSDEVLIGHIGRFTTQKNHYFLINIFYEIQKKYCNYKLILIGDGELKNDIEAYVKKIGLNEKVIFAGVLENVNEFYSAFDIFVLPSIWEGLPVVAIEAQTSGIPCIFSSNIDTSAIINDNSIMLDIDVESWCKEIINMDITNRKKGYEKIKERGFDINQQVNRIDCIYRGELNGRSN